jgi:hypothetical protein
MNNDRFPAHQNMISNMPPDQVMQKFESDMKFYGAGANDCRIENMKDCYSYENPFKCRYQLYWDTYIGWKVYMLHTGCLASDPRFENS